MNHYPFPLKPMNLGNILDYTFRVYRNNAKTILAYSVLISGLFSVAILLLSNAIAPTPSVPNPFSGIIEALRTGNWSLIRPQNPEIYNAANSALAETIRFISSIINLIFIYPFVQGGISRTASRYFHGYADDMGTSFRQTRNIFGKLIATTMAIIAYGILIAFCFFITIIFPIIIIFSIFDSLAGTKGFLVLFLLLIFFILLMLLTIIPIIFISFVFPVAVSENTFGFKAIGRSMRLVQKSFWRTLGITILIGLLSYALSLAAESILGIILVLSPNIGFLQQIVNVLLTALITPVSYIAVTLLYLDTRIRLEGYDIQLMSSSLEIQSSGDQMEC